MDKQVYLILGASSLAAAGAGFFVGQKYAFKKFYTAYEETLAGEIRKTKEFYANLHKAEHPTPGDAVDALITGEEVIDNEGDLLKATVALRKYGNVTVKPEDLVDQPTISGAIYDGMYKTVTAPVETVEAEVEHRNVFADNLVNHVVEDRDTSGPYIVGYSEYVEHPEGYDEVNLTYYEGDGVLGDDSDEPIADGQVDELVGRKNLTGFGISDPDDPHILLIRNDQKKLDIEITHSEGKFAHEVLGFNHSDEPMKRRPRWDDE